MSKGKKHKEKPAAPKRDSPAPPPPAGPHARPELTDPDKTPGTGSLPDPRRDEIAPGTS